MSKRALKTCVLLCPIWLVRELWLCISEWGVCGMSGLEDKKLSKIIFDDGESIKVRIGVIAEFSNGFLKLESGELINSNKIIRVEPLEAKA